VTAVVSTNSRATSADLGKRRQGLRLPGRQRRDRCDHRLCAAPVGGVIHCDRRPGAAKNPWRIPAPMPLDAPVTRATLPSNLGHGSTSSEDLVVAPEMPAPLQGDTRPVGRLAGAAATCPRAATVGQGRRRLGCALGVLG